jgi:beta-phosphoglucomutase family hydrolase
VTSGEGDAQDQRRIGAVILDLDGVITRTDTLHFLAWKDSFEALFARVDPSQPAFTEADYREHVDGKPRLDGVRDLVAARGIELPEGGEDDALESETVVGVGNDKNARYHRLLEERGPEVFPDAEDRVREWKSAGLRTAVVSSSRNCKLVLETAGLSDLFETRVDGVTLAEEGLAGKPAPDLFLRAAERLGVSPESAAIFEDATSGVEAGARGGFGLVVGVDRDGGRGKALSDHGADVVVSTLREVEL